MIRSRILFSILIILIASITSCKKKNNVTCDGSTPTYNSYVQGIVNNNCIGCHSNFGTYSGISTVTSNGKFEKEVLIDQRMPKGGSLSEDELSKLQCWVQNGFPEN